MAEEKEKSKKKKVEELRARLFSEDNEELLQALKEVRKMGDASFVAPLLEAYRQSKHEKVSAEIASLLSTLKVSGVESAFIESLASERFKAVHKDILNFMWNSGINVPEHVGLIVEVSLQGDFIQLLEGITLIEHMEGPHQEVQLTDGLLTLRKFMAANKDESKKELSDTLYMLLVDLESQV